MTRLALPPGPDHAANAAPDEPLRFGNVRPFTGWNDFGPRIWRNLPQAERLHWRRCVCTIGLYAPAHAFVVEAMRAGGFDPYRANRDELTSHAAAVLDAFTEHGHALREHLPPDVYDAMERAEANAEAVFRVLDVGTPDFSPPPPRPAFL